MAVEISHGRGGAGNINPDTTEYVDGEVVRAGVEGSHGDGAYSAGRGGAGNIGDVGSASATRTGRGGAGNEHVADGQRDKSVRKTEEGAAVAPVSLADRLKQKLFGVMKK